MKPQKPRITQPVLKVLKVFIDSPCQELSGSDIRQITGLATGTLYPVLVRLEDFGWLESDWEDVDPSEVGRPRKRLYQITKLGITQAQSEFDSIIGKTNNRLGEGYA